VAKGTFYHYFDAKVDILDALIQRLLEHMLASLQVIIEDPSLNAIQKLEQFFWSINQWKIESKPLLLETARVLYQDENILLREKMTQASAKSFTPLLATIIAQGKQEGVFNVEYPYETAEIIFFMPRIFAETLIPLLLSNTDDDELLAHVQRQIIVYSLSVERVLGMTTESLKLFSLDDLNRWLSDDTG